MTDHSLSFFYMMLRITDPEHPDRVNHRTKADPVLRSALRLTSIMKDAGFRFQQRDPWTPDSSVVLRGRGVQVILDKTQADPDDIRHNFYLAALDNRGHTLGGLGLSIYHDPDTDRLTHSYILHGPGDHTNARIISHGLSECSENAATRKFKNLIEGFLNDHISGSPAHSPDFKP